MTNKDMEPDDSPTQKYSGSALQQYMYEFLNENIDLVKELRIHEKQIPFGRVLIIRCTLLEKFLSILEDHALVSENSLQHNITRDFLNFVLYKSGRETTERVGADNRRFDIVHKRLKIELKTRSKVPKEKLEAFLKLYRVNIIEDIDIKNIWWFAFLYRTQPTTINKRGCSTYMIIMELDKRKSKLKKANKDEMGIKLAKIEAELAHETRKSISEVELEDFGAEGLLVPVDNVILVERLREGKAKERKDKLKERKEKEEALSLLDSERKEKEMERNEKEMERKEKEKAIAKVKLLEEELKKYKQKDLEKI